MSSSSIIRLATVSDAAQIQAIYAPFVTDTPVSFETEPPSIEEMERRIQATLRTFPWLVCEHHGTVAGYVYATSHRARAAYMWSVDVAVYTHPDYRRCGVGKALYTSLFKILTLQGFYNAYAGVTLPNPASVGLHEALGFEPVGVYTSAGYKAQAWHDVGWWQFALQERDSPPAVPVSLEEVTHRPEWPVALSAGMPLLSS